MGLKGCQTEGLGTTVTGASRWNMFNKSAIAACLVQCPFLGQPDSAYNGGNWAQSGHLHRFLLQSPC
jgi:hypothetical protein